jgi:peptide/nickel transport system substrate-binding protein
MDSQVPVEGGVATWACMAGFPPAVIFPFTPAERYGSRNVYEFQMFMYRPLYWYGRRGSLEIDFDLSLGDEPEWEPDGRACTVRIKPWKWSNGETVCADNVMLFMHLLCRKATRFGLYVAGYFPDNLVSFEKVADDAVRFTFDTVYSKRWVLFNQLTMITPFPKAWDRTAGGPADASHDPDQAEAVYDYLMAENGDPVAEDNSHRTRWPASPIWSVVNGPWRLKRYTMDGNVTFVPNQHYSGPNPAHLDEFRLTQTDTDEAQFEVMRQRGPRGAGSIQVGFLPLGAGEQPDGDPTVGGPNPLGAGYTLYPQVTFAITFMALNFGNPAIAGNLIRQAYLRQALQSCIDQEYGEREIYRGYGWAQPGPVPILPRNEFVAPSLRTGYGRWPFDLERARALLVANGWDVSRTPAVCVRPGTGPGEAGAGIPAGTKLSLSLRYADGRPAMARLMKQFAADAAKAGIELRLSAIVGSVLAAEDGPGAGKLWEISNWGGGWSYNLPTGENLFAGDATANFSNYRDARADELIARTVSTDDLAALYEYQEYLAEQVPVLFLPTTPRRVFEVASHLRGFAPVNPYGLQNPENWYYVEDAG